MKKVRFIEDFATKKAGETDQYDGQVASSLVRRGIAEAIEDDETKVKESSKDEEIAGLKEEIETLKSEKKILEDKAEKLEEITDVIEGDEEKVEEEKPTEKRAAPRAKPKAKPKAKTNTDTKK